MLLERAAKFFVEDIVNAMRGLGIEPAQLLETASRSRLEFFQPFGDAMLNRGVVTDIEMEEVVFLETSPIAAVKGSMILNIERPCHNASASFGEHQTEV